MEVDGVSSHVADDNPSHCSVSVLLHPIVVLSISEHWMREKLANESDAVSVFGALLGKQNGRHVEVTSSFELLLGSEKNVDLEFFNDREAQCKQIYPDLDLVGWYTTGGIITEEDKLFHCQMQEINESLLIIKLDPHDQFGEQLPVRVYESVVDNDARVLFKQVSYNFAHEETESIGIDHVARVSSFSSNKDSSLTAEYLMVNYQAVQMLLRRLRLLKAYVDSVAKGELPPNWPRLREISSIIQRMPLVMNSLKQPNECASFSATSMSDQLLRQANDVCLTALLGSLTQSVQTLCTWLTQSSQSMSRRSESASLHSYSKRMLPERPGGELIYIAPTGEDNL